MMLLLLMYSCTVAVHTCDAPSYHIYDAPYLIFMMLLLLRYSCTVTVHIYDAPSYHIYDGPFLIFMMLLLLMYSCTVAVRSSFSCTVAVRSSFSCTVAVFFTLNHHRLFSCDNCYQYVHTAMTAATNRCIWL